MICVCVLFCVCRVLYVVCCVAGWCSLCVSVAAYGLMFVVRCDFPLIESCVLFVVRCSLGVVLSGVCCVRCVSFVA